MEIKEIRVILSKGAMLPRKVCRTFYVVSFILIVFYSIIIPVCSESVILIIIGIIGCFCFFGLTGILGLWGAVRAKRLNNYAKQCLSDNIIKLRAFAKLYGEDGGLQGIISATKRVKVEFMYEGKKHVLYSPIKKNGHIAAGFNKYVNKAIWIYYSPKYDDALITKKDWEYSKTKK